MSAVTDGHTTRILTTRSGSTYHVVGDEVRRTRAGAPDEVFRLISVGARCLRYTDGQTIYISSEVVARNGV